MDLEALAKVDLKSYSDQLTMQLRWMDRGLRFTRATVWGGKDGDWGRGHRCPGRANFPWSLLSDYYPEQFFQCLQSGTRFLQRRQGKEELRILNPSANVSAAVEALKTYLKDNPSGSDVIKSFYNVC